MWITIDPSQEPFRWRVSMLNEGGMTYSQMEAGSDRARSLTWWNNLVRHGAWEPERARVAPPPPEAVPGIAKLFSKTEKEVRAMIAADWYRVYPPRTVSARVRQIETPLNSLTNEDAALVEALVRSLAEKKSKEA